MAQCHRVLRIRLQDRRISGDHEGPAILVGAHASRERYSIIRPRRSTNQLRNHAGFDIRAVHGDRSRYGLREHERQWSESEEFLCDRRCKSLGGAAGSGWYDVGSIGAEWEDGVDATAQLVRVCVASFDV